MSRATGSLLGHRAGQAVLIVAVVAEVALLALFTIVLEVGKAAWDRMQVQGALLLASDAAVREIVIPVGPQGVRLDPTLANSAFTHVLALDIPAELAGKVIGQMVTAAAGDTDPHTGFTFSAAGVMASASFHDIILGQQVAETLYVDTEVHTGVDWTPSAGRLALGFIPGPRRSGGQLPGGRL